MKELLELYISHDEELQCILQITKCEYFHCQSHNCTTCYHEHVEHFTLVLEKQFTLPTKRMFGIGLKQGRDKF